MCSIPAQVCVGPMGFCYVGDMYSTDRPNPTYMPVADLAEASASAKRQAPQNVHPITCATVGDALLVAAASHTPIAVPVAAKRARTGTRHETATVEMPRSPDEYAVGTKYRARKGGWDRKIPEALQAHAGDGEVVWIATITDVDADVVVSTTTTTNRYRSNYKTEWVWQIEWRNYYPKDTQNDWYVTMDEAKEVAAAFVEEMAAQNRESRATVVPVQRQITTGDTAELQSHTVFGRKVRSQVTFDMEIGVYGPQSDQIGGWVLDSPARTNGGTQ